MGEVVSMTVDGINAAIAAALSGAGLSEAEVQALIDAGLASLVDTAPGTLDTLNELAAALGDDENFASNIITSISGVKSGSVGVVIHGSDPNVVRPTGYGVIHWIGSVDPVNATNNDYWTDPDEVNGTLPTAVKLAFLNSGTVLNQKRLELQFHDHLENLVDAKHLSQQHQHMMIHHQHRKQLV